MQLGKAGGCQAAPACWPPAAGRQASPHRLSASLSNTAVGVGQNQLSRDEIYHA